MPWSSVAAVAVHDRAPSLAVRVSSGELAVAAPQLIEAAGLPATEPGSSLVARPRRVAATSCLGLARRRFRLAGCWHIHRFSLAGPSPLACSRGVRSRRSTLSAFTVVREHAPLYVVCGRTPGPARGDFVFVPQSCGCRDPPSVVTGRLLTRV